MNPPHSHPAETSIALVESFRKALTRRAAVEKLDLQRIYLEEATARHSEAALHYPFCTAQPTMAKARSKATHNAVLPGVTDWQEAGEMLKTTQNFTIVYCGQREAFFDEILSRDGHTIALIFSHKPTVQRFVGSLNEVQVDITWLNEESRFLLSIHHLDRQTAKTTPLVYVLLNGKSQDIYTAVFAHVRERLRILPAVIIADSVQDCRLHPSLQLTFPEASIKANWFEYVDSVSRQVRESPDVFLPSTNKAVLRMILVLPFLPADYMAPGLEAIRKWMIDRRVDTTVGGPLWSLCRCIETTWLRGVGAGRLSMFRVTISVQDNMKEFHSEVQCLTGGGTQRASIWRTIEGLTALAARVNSQGLEGQWKKNSSSAAAGGNKNQLLSEAVIRNATEQWITQPIHLRSPLQFLQMSSHFITKMFLSRVVRSSGELEDREVDKEKEVPPQEPPELAQLTRAASSTASHCGGTLQPSRLPSEPPPLAFLPQILDKAREQVKLLDKRKRMTHASKDPPPLMPIIRTNNNK